MVISANDLHFFFLVNVLNFATFYQLVLSSDYIHWSIMLGLQAVLFCVSKLVNVMLTIFTVVMYFAETCNHILQILAFSLPMIVNECIFWLTTDHG